MTIEQINILFNIIIFYLLLLLFYLAKMSEMQIESHKYLHLVTIFVLSHLWPLMYPFLEEIYYFSYLCQKRLKLYTLGLSVYNANAREVWHSQILYIWQPSFSLTSMIIWHSLFERHTCFCKWLSNFKEVTNIYIWWPYKYWHKCGKENKYSSQMWNMDHMTFIF